MSGLCAAVSGWGVHGDNSAGGTGVYGSSSSGYGVSGYSPSGGGVIGTSTSGRGGVFGGETAHIELLQGGQATHPASGTVGDFYLDTAARLWFCQGGTTWVDLTATTTVAIAAGWNLIGVAPGSAGLMAPHVLSTLLPATGGTLAALYGLTNGHWTPSFIVHNAQTIGTDFPLAAGHGYLLYSDTMLASFTLQAPVQVSAVRPGSHLSGTGAGGGTLPPVPVLPGQH